MKKIGTQKKLTAAHAVCGVKLAGLRLRPAMEAETAKERIKP